MQYILTEEEYKELNKKANSKVFELGYLNKKKLGVLCQKIADTMPIDDGWKEKEAPWGCIHSVKDCEWYCDKCPVQEICPLSQHFSQ